MFGKRERELIKKEYTKLHKMFVRLWNKTGHITTRTYVQACVGWSKYTTAAWYWKLNSCKLNMKSCKGKTLNMSLKKRNCRYFEKKLHSGFKCGPTVPENCAILCYLRFFPKFSQYFFLLINWKESNTREYNKLMRIIRNYTCTA